MAFDLFRLCRFSSGSCLACCTSLACCTGSLARCGEGTTDTSCAATTQAFSGGGKSSAHILGASGRGNASCQLEGATDNAARLLLAGHVNGAAQQRSEGCQVSVGALEAPPKEAVVR